MNPYAKYIDCINCGNELTNISSLTYHTPQEVACDFCGQVYNGLAQKVKKVKALISIVFLVLGVLLFLLTTSLGGFISGLFALFPLLIIYVFVLGYGVKKTIGF